MKSSARGTSTTPLPPLVEALRRFAKLHSLRHLNNASLESPLAAVVPADHAAMYVALSNLLPHVPAHLHQNLFDAMSDALITPHTPISVPNLHPSNPASQSTSDRLAYILSLMQKAIREGSSSKSALTSGHQSSALLPQNAPANQLSSSAPPTPSSVMTNAQPQARKKAPRSTLSKSVRTEQKSNPEPERQMKPDKPAKTWDLPPASGFVVSPEPLHVSLLEHCGISPCVSTNENFHRRFGTSFFTTPASLKSAPSDKIIYSIPNAHASALQRAGHVPRCDLPNVYIPARRQWTPKESNALKEAVIHHANLPADAKDHRTLQKIVSTWDTDIWKTIANKHSHEIGHRMANMARVQFLKVEAPWNVFKEWTQSEDSLLISAERVRECLKEENGGWESVSHAIGNTHSPVHCLRRWRYLQDEPIRKELRRNWEDWEIKRLHELRTRYTFRSWEVIALALGTLRTAQQCLHQFDELARHDSRKPGDESKRVKTNYERCGNQGLTEITKHVNRNNYVQNKEEQLHCTPPFVRGIWNAEEDARLRQAVASLGTNWKAVAEAVGSRNANQCLRRWNVIWSNEEETKLLNAVNEKVDVNWKLVSERVGTKSESQCRRHATLLKRRANDDITKTSSAPKIAKKPCKDERTNLETSQSC